MSFYTALTGLNGAQADISASSNNIANVGTTGFKRSRAEFGDIFATSPLQNASSSIGSGAILKGIKQQFTQGNIASSLNALDLAISGQGFFSLKPSLTSSQTVFTRNGSFNVDNDRYVVDSAGQYLMTYPVNADGSVTAKDLDSAVPLQLPVTSGEPNATSNIQLGVNVPADAAVIPNLPEFSDGYTFNSNDPSTYTNSTSITIFDDLGNPTIATIYFIKTQTASAEDPTNKYDTRLVINGTVIQPDLVSAVDQSGKQVFIDRFGNQTTTVPDDNYFLEGKGSPLYKLDDLNQQVPSQPAAIRGEQSGFDFGEEGDKLVEIVTDPLQYQATRDAGRTGSDIFWGRDFLMVNVDDGDAPVSVDLRPGKYNATQLAAEVERAINDAYGDDKKFQIVQNVDDELTIDLFKVGADGTPIGLGDNRISVDLLQPTTVSQLSGIDISGASPDFSKEEFLVHTQERINATLNDYIYASDGTIGSGATTLGVNGRIFSRASGQAIDQLHSSSAIIEVNHYTGSNEVVGGTAVPKYLAYSYLSGRPSLAVFDKKAELAQPPNGNKLSYDATQNTLSVYVEASDYNNANSASIQLQGATLDSALNGRALRVLDAGGTTETLGSNPAVAYVLLKVDTSGLALSESNFTDNSTINLLFNPSSDVEAFFEGSESGTEGVLTTFNSKKIVLREIGSAATRATGSTSFDNAFVIDSAKNTAADSAITALGLANLKVSDISSPTSTEINTLRSSNRANWVDEKNPPIKVSFDDVNQRLQFTADRTVLGTGTGSNFNSFTITGAAGASDTNNLGIPDPGNAQQVLIRGGEVMSADSFIADGEEIQLNDKRFGVQVGYNSDTKSFTVLSGTTGETISVNGALGVDSNQKSSNIQIGRRTILSNGNIDPSETIDLNTRIIGGGENSLFGFGATKTDFAFSAGRGLASDPAIASGKAAQSDLTEVFRLTTNNNENIFNVSVNGISGVIAIPPGNYVGTTLATALEERVNQIADPVTGVSVGGVKVRYSAASNNFTFTTGTTGDTSTIKVKGAARLGLDDVPLGVGAVPKIFNLVQATNEDGLALFVDADGNVVSSPPESLVTGYFPLYIDEGELTFDKTGKLISPQNKVHFEQQADGFSISLDVDFSASSQFAQPFSVLSVEQDGFTSGRLDGIEIDSSGTIRANYTNGQNNPLGKIVIASFNNQNGLKQIGNATYVETAVSGRPQVGEAGAEGFGTIQSGSLERSNVDITEELVNLITAQRNYQASAKAIETTTSLTQTIINIRM
ncbi:MAG: flagellar hook-basal body complex protein [Proteobacteria bacterium]|nr:flagellar hook-basal body complex protein [Pseudomonadota bacterium]